MGPAGEGSGGGDVDGSLVGVVAAALPANSGGPIGRCKANGLMVWWLQGEGGLGVVRWFKRRAQGRVLEDLLAIASAVMFVFLGPVFMRGCPFMCVAQYGRNRSLFLFAYSL